MMRRWSQGKAKAVSGSYMLLGRPFLFENEA
jgi:hypothetical protein